MKTDQWSNIPFSERNEIILNRMHECGMELQYLNVPLHALTDAWCAYVTALLRGDSGNEAATDAETTLAALNVLCADLGLPPYSDGVPGDALEAAHAMLMQAYARR